VLNKNVNRVTFFIAIFWHIRAFLIVFAGSEND